MVTYIVVALLLGALSFVFVLLCDKYNIKEQISTATVCSVIGFLFWGAIHWWLTPNLSLDYYPLYLEAFITLLFYGVIFSASEGDDVSAKMFIPSILLLIIFIGVWIYSWDLFHYEDKYKMLQVEETTDLVETSISPIPVEKMTIMNTEVAQALIGQKMNDLGNRCQIGKFSKQSFTGKFKAKEFNGNEVEIDYQNQIVYVAPLEHNSFFKWNEYDYTEGYALVNASNPSEYYLIKEVNGEPLKLRYLESAYFNDNIERYVRKNGYAAAILDDFGIELDESGRPFNVISILENTIAWGTPKAIGSLIVDIQTGDMKEYDIEHTPSFVNLVQPHSVIDEYLYYWGEYVHDYIDLSDRDRKVATPGMDIVHDGKDGCCYYVGIQSKTAADDSNNVATIGFMKINTITGKATFYKRDGINEPAANRAMSADVSIAQDIKLGTVELDDAVFYNIEGMPTYFTVFISTKDNMPKYYGFCSAYNKEVVGVGTSLLKAKADYLRSYSEYNQRQGLRSSAKDVANIRRTLTVKEKVQENDCYYFRFEETGDTVFYGYSELLPNVRWKNDTPTITYRKSNETNIALMAFE